MSTFGGTPTTAGQSVDPGLNLAPPENEGPDFGALKKSFDDCVSNLRPYVDQCLQNFETRYALWNGQSADGKKHAGTNANTDPVPWDGASDLRVFLIDEAIISKVALLCMSAHRANIVATPIEGNDLKRAKVVSNFLRWLRETQMPEIDRETELLANYIQEKGVAATGQFWETCQEKTLATVTIQQMQEQFPNIDMQALVESDAVADDLYALFEEIYGCSRKKAKAMLVELRAKGVATVPVVGKSYSRPVVRAFNLDQDLFIPTFSTDLETAPAIYRVQYFTAEKLRSFVHTDSWDEGWVEGAIERCRGRLITLNQNEHQQPISRSFVYQTQRFTDLIGVVYAYQRLSDEDGVPGIYLTIFNPELPPDASHDGYAKFGLLGYAHGQYPFVLHRREFLSRKLHDSRGIPEPGKPWQDQLKAHRDSLIDAASLAILPPMGYPIGRPPGRWGAGARVPERRPNEYHYLDAPKFDPSTDRSQELLSESFNRYNGFVSRDSDPQFAQLKNQLEVEKFLGGWSQAYRQIWKLWQQFGSDETYFRVIGLKSNDPQLMTKGDPKEDYDISLNFDIGSMDWEQQEKKIQALAQVVQTFDKYGQVDFSELLQIAIANIDINWAEKIITPKEVGTAKVVDEIHTTLAQVFSGVEKDISLSWPPELAQQVVQQYAQSPDVAQRYQQDESFKARIDKIVKQIRMQLMQNENKKIGRLGA